MAAIDYISSLTFNNASLKRILNTGDTAAKIFGPAVSPRGVPTKRTDSQKIQSLNRLVFSVTHFVDSELLSQKAGKEPQIFFQEEAVVKRPANSTSRRTETNEPGRTASLRDMPFIMAKHDRLVSQAMESMRKSLGISGTIEANAVQIHVSEMDSLLMIAKNVNKTETGIRASIIAVASNEYHLLIEAENATMLAHSFLQAHGGNTPFLTSRLTGQSQPITSPEHMQSRPFPSAGKPLALMTGSHGAGHTLRLLGTNMEWTDITVRLREESLISLTGKINSANIPGVAAAVEMTPGVNTISYSLRLFGISKTAMEGSRELLNVMSFSDKTATISRGIFTINEGPGSGAENPPVLIMIAETSLESPEKITLSIPGPENKAIIESYNAFPGVDEKFTGTLHLPTIFKDMNNLALHMKFVKGQASISEFIDSMRGQGGQPENPVLKDNGDHLQDLSIPADVFAAKYTIEKIFVTDIVLADTGRISFPPADGGWPESGNPRTISVPVFLPEAFTDQDIPAYRLAISILRAEEISGNFGGTQPGFHGVSSSDTPEAVSGSGFLPDFSFSQGMLRGRLASFEVRTTVIGLRESEHRYNLLAGIAEGKGNGAGSGSITGNEQTQTVSGRIMVNTNPDGTFPVTDSTQSSTGFARVFPDQIPPPGVVHHDQIHRLVEKMATLIDLVNSTFNALGGQAEPDGTKQARQSSGTPSHQGILLAQEKMNGIFQDLAEDLSAMKTSALLGLTITNGKRISLDTAILENSLSGNGEETVNALKNFGHSLFERLHFYFDPSSGTMIHFKKTANDALQTPGQLDDDLNQELIKQKESLEKRLRTVDYLISNTTERIEWLKPLARVFPETSPSEDDFVDASLEPDNA